MKKIAFLVTHGYYPSRPDRDEVAYAANQLALLVPEFEAHGLSLQPVHWQDDNIAWADFVAVLPIMAWNYPQQVETFLSRLNEIEAAGVAIFNPANILRANMDKSYLVELASKGAPVPATLSLDQCSPEAILESFDKLETDEIIIKPRIGAGAWRQARLKRGEALPSVEILPPAAALIQPFLQSVTQSGELSLLFFGGVFSHALAKRPKAGDYRTQGQFGAVEIGIEAPEAARAAAHKVLELATSVPLPYARVDLVQGPDGQWLLMELELIEPWLYLAQDGHDGHHGAKLFASAIASALSGST